jgi:hypothetical protein
MRSSPEPIMPPQPVYGPDTLLAGLETAEMLLAVTLRLYALPWQEPDRDHPDWREGLQAGSLPPWTSLAFEALLRIVVAATRRPLDVRCLHCPSLGYDEGRLLQLIGLFQHRRNEEAAAVLESWLPTAACRLAVSPACGLAKGLRQADLVIPLRRRVTAPIPPHHIAIHPGLMLVH